MMFGTRSRELPLVWYVGWCPMSAQETGSCFTTALVLQHPRVICLQ